MSTRSRRTRAHHRPPLLRACLLGQPGPADDAAIPVSLREILSGALATSATDRWRSMEELRDALSAVGGRRLKARDGRFIPLSSVTALREIAVAPALGRESQRRAVPIRVSPLMAGTAAGRAASAGRATRPYDPGPAESSRVASG